MSELKTLTVSVPTFELTFRWSSSPPRPCSRLPANVPMSETPAAQPYPVPEFATPTASRAVASVPVHPGTQQLSVTVTVIFALG